MRIGMEADLPVDLIIGWLKTEITGCAFARKFANEPKPATIRFLTLRVAPDNAQLGDFLHAFLTQAAGEHAAALFIFPKLRTDEDIAGLLSTLTRNASFKLSERPWPSGVNRDDILARLEWHTPSGHRSQALGLAPSGIMPVTRRAPFICLFLWPGSHENIFRSEPYPTVGVADMKFDMKESAYRRLWDKTIAEKAKRDAEEPNASASFREVAFCLPQRVRRLLEFQS